MVAITVCETAARGGGTAARVRAPGLPLWLAAVLGLGLLAAGIGPAARAQSLSPAQLEHRVQVISDQLRCPTCQDLSVWESEASFSQQIREKVRAMVLEGQSDDQILAYFVSRYGQWILRAPHKRGWGLVLWLLPGVAVVGVGAWLLRRIWAGSRARVAPVALAALSPQQIERLTRDRTQYEEED
ncbi:MAG TPA: cytochrome c-type biogenesis protein [bacterium]|nr:cytochrome c-type biogenesis protein [bacterium]